MERGSFCPLLGGQARLGLPRCFGLKKTHLAFFGTWGRVCVCVCVCAPFFTEHPPASGGVI